MAQEIDPLVVCAAGAGGAEAETGERGRDRVFVVGAQVDVCGAGEGGLGCVGEERVEVMVGLGFGNWWGGGGFGSSWFAGAFGLWFGS